MDLGLWIWDYECGISDLGIRIQDYISRTTDPDYDLDYGSRFKSVLQIWITDYRIQIQIMLVIIG